MTAPSLLRRIVNTLTRSRRKRIGTIDVSNDGFVFTFRRRETTIRWSEITRIDAGMRDYFSFDGLYVIVYAGAVKLELDELDDGFRQFESAVFERWPQTRERWNKLLATSPHQPQYETLWQRDG